MITYLNWCHARTCTHTYTHTHTHMHTQEYYCYADFDGLKTHLKDYDYDYDYSKYSVDYGYKVRMQAIVQSCGSIKMLCNVGVHAFHTLMAPKELMLVCGYGEWKMSEDECS